MDGKATAAAAAEERRYAASAAAVIDRKVDAARRIRADLAAGHLPSCGLLKCDPRCARAKGA